jgi:hypothetical protein
MTAVGNVAMGEYKSVIRKDQHSPDCVHVLNCAHLSMVLFNKLPILHIQVLITTNDSRKCVISLLFFCSVTKRAYFSEHCTFLFQSRLQAQNEVDAFLYCNLVDIQQ